MLWACRTRTKPVKAEVGTNPKEAFGDKKLPLQILPSIAELHWTWAQADGAKKYGPFNWRDVEVDSQTYVGGIKRHLKKWVAGEIFDKDSGAHHLGHIMANCAILMDAEVNGTLVKFEPTEADKLAIEFMYEFEKRMDSEPVDTNT